MQKWEYLTLEMDLGIADSKSRTKFLNGEHIPAKDQKPFHSFLKELGVQGWELVSVQGIFYYFKRPIE